MLSEDAFTDWSEVMKTLDQIRSRPHVAKVDDERSIGNSIIVTLKEGYYFKADPGCGVMGFDTAREAADGTRSAEVYVKDAKVAA